MIPDPDTSNTILTQPNIAQRARSALENIPGAVEDTITRLEKKSKDMEKNGSSQATKQKMLQDLLSRL